MSDANPNRKDPGAGQAAGTPGAAVPSAAKLRWTGAVALVLLAVVVFIVLKRQPQASAQSKPAPSARGGGAPVPVVAGTAVRKDVPIYLDGLGTVQAFNTVTVRSRVDGQVQKLAFTEGQDVRAGDLLAQIDPDPYRTQVEQADAKKAQDEAQLTFARVELKRDADLLATKILSQEGFDTQQAQVNQLEAAVKADQAAIESARVQLNYASITAPIDGRTGIRLVDQGNIIRASDSSNAIVVLTQLKPISVVFTLPEQSLKEIQTQMSSGAMTVLAVDRDNSTELDEGKLAVIDNQIDTATGTIRLKANYPNASLRLWPGQFVNARLLLTVCKGGTVVQASVIQRGPEGAFAFVIKNDMTVEVRPVKVRQTDQGVALLNDEGLRPGEGLHPGERVVVEGQYRLQAGSKVKPSQSATVQDEGAETSEESP
jgi:multidrug efflux system membrane fusion protein